MQGIPYVPDIAEEQPTDGNADLPGAMGLTMPVAVGLSRAGRVQEESEKLTGPEANCRIGDFRMDNAVISVCIKAETTFSQLSFLEGTSSMRIEQTDRARIASGSLSLLRLSGKSVLTP